MLWTVSVIVCGHTTLWRNKRTQKTNVHQLIYGIAVADPEILKKWKAPSYFSVLYGKSGLVEKTF